MESSFTEGDKDAKIKKLTEINRKLYEFAMRKILNDAVCQQYKDLKRRKKHVSPKKRRLEEEVAGDADDENDSMMVSEDPNYDDSTIELSDG